MESLVEGIIFPAAFAVAYLCVDVQHIFCRGRGREGSMIHWTCRTYTCVALKGEDTQIRQQVSFSVGKAVQHWGRSTHEHVMSSLLVVFWTHTDKAMTDLV